jgi:hypothetical protein
MEVFFGETLGHQGGDIKLNSHSPSNLFREFFSVCSSANNKDWRTKASGLFTANSQTKP